jgi:predicted nucleic acid-binding protein
MSSPAAKVFLDTDCIMHLYSSDSGAKAAAMRELVDQVGTRNIVVSTQVLEEFCSLCLRQFSLPASTVLKALSELLGAFRISENDVETVIEAVWLSEQYNCSFNQAHILATALQAHCEYIYTENLPDGLIVEETLCVVNPFAAEQEKASEGSPKLAA